MACWPSITFEPWFWGASPRKYLFCCISQVLALMGMKLSFFVVLWYFFSAMPQVWSKFDVPSGIYSNFPTTCWFLSFPGDLNCIVFPAQNNWYKILKLVLEILQTVHNPMKLVPLNLYTLGRSYDCFTQKSFLRLVNRTSQIPYLPHGVATNVRWPRSWNFYHR